MDNMVTFLASVVASAMALRFPMVGLHSSLMVSAEAVIVHPLKPPRGFVYC